MNYLVPVLALCGALAGCATYAPSYPAYPVQVDVATGQPVYVYPSYPTYPYAYPYPYVYPYAYPYAYGASYWSPSIWISGHSRSGWGRHDRHGTRGHDGTRWRR